jgi:pimeloyl-ACP methyl ester carboxylesterase
MGHVVVDPPFGLPGVVAARVPTHGVTLSVLEAGPCDGPLVVLLHGFPELSYTWKAQLAALSEAGCFVVAPDQRGYATSDKPEGIRAYHLDELARDTVGLIDHYGREDAVVVGHDWGAAVAWWVALQHPQRVRRLVVMNVPHPTVFERTLRTNLGQLKRSWYMGFFQLPHFPERAITKAPASSCARATPARSPTTICPYTATPGASPAPPPACSTGIARCAIGPARRRRG